MIQTDIYSRVIEHKNFLIEKHNFNEDSLIGVFPFGSMNYGLFEDGISDVDTKAIYVPTYKELVFDRPISEVYSLPPGNEHIEVKDIRLMVDMWKKQNINFLEILFTDYDWINPKYSYLWANTFYMDRQNIAKYNLNYMANSICGQARGYIKDLKKEYNPKKAMNLVRLQRTLEKYLFLYLPFNQSISFDYFNNHYMTRENLLKIKHGEIVLTNSDFESLEHFFNICPTYNSSFGLDDYNREIFDSYFNNYILAFLKEREVML